MFLRIEYNLKGLMLYVYAYLSISEYDICLYKKIC